MPNWKKLITSGSAASLSSLTTSGNISGSSTSTGSIAYLEVADKLELGGPGSQFFAFNEDTVKVKFANWYSSNDRQYGMGQLYFETWFAAIDNQASRDERRIGFYLEEPNAGASDAAGGGGTHPTNARFYVDINGAYLSGSLEASRVNLGSTVGSTFLSGDPVMTANGYIMAKAIVNTSETGTSPAAITFGDGSTLGSDQISLVTAGQNAIYIDSSQNVHIPNGDLRATNDVIAFYSSDKRLKDNIVRIENPLEKIKKIGGYEFDWNDKQKTYEGHDVGVIAQEIQEVLPEVVTERDTGYLAVKYEKIVPLLIESIKELKQEVDEIKQKCDCLNK